MRFCSSIMPPCSLGCEFLLASMAGAAAMPLADVMDFGDGRFALDRLVICRVVDAAITADPRHTPRTVKRDASKIDT